MISPKPCEESGKIQSLRSGNLATASDADLLAEIARRNDARLAAAEAAGRGWIVDLCLLAENPNIKPGVRDRCRKLADHIDTELNTINALEGRS